MSEHEESVQSGQLLLGASELVVVDGDYNPRKRRDNRVLARSCSPGMLSAAVDAVAFAEGERTAWMTPGWPTLVFLSGRQVLASLTCLSPGRIRCEELWDGDAPLVNESAVLDLLRDLGVDPSGEGNDRAKS